MIAGSLFVEIVPLDFEIAYCFSFCEDDADALSEIRFAVFESVILYTGSKVTFSKLLEMAGIKKKKHFVKAGDDNE